MLISSWLYSAKDAVVGIPYLGLVAARRIFPLDEGARAIGPSARGGAIGERLLDAPGEPFGRRLDEKGEGVVEELGVRRDPGGDERPAGGHVRVHLERRVRSEEHTSELQSPMYLV